MPQLNPNPWFVTMLISWITYSFIIQPKILAFITPNPPSNKTNTAPNTTPWTWPWA